MGSQRVDAVERTPLKMPGYWRRPIARVYSYNLDLGENYYSPMKDFVSSPDYGDREKSPGALTYSERIARKFMESDNDRADRMFRAKSEVRSRESGNARRDQGNEQWTSSYFCKATDRD